MHTKKTPQQDAVVDGGLVREKEKRGPDGSAGAVAPKERDTPRTPSTLLVNRAAKLAATPNRMMRSMGDRRGAPRIDTRAGAVVQRAWTAPGYDGQIFLNNELPQFLNSTRDLGWIKQKATRVQNSNDPNAVVRSIVASIINQNQSDQGFIAGLEDKVAQINAEKTEDSEGGHSLARHGPDVSDDLLKKRLFTGIAPDNHLSPAPGASSRFTDYRTVLSTRQAAATALTNAIAAAQQRVLAWHQNVYTPGVLDQTVVQKNQDKNNRELQKNQSQTALTNYRTNTLNPRQTTFQNLEDPLQEARQRLQTITDSLTDDLNYAEADIFSGPEPLEASDRRDFLLEQAQLQQQIPILEQGIAGPQNLYQQAQAQETLLSANLNAAAVNFETAKEEHATAVDEQANPGKNLRKVLDAADAFGLVVANNAGAANLETTVKLKDQYSVNVDHGDTIGTGFVGPDSDEVSLTSVFEQAVADDSTDPPTPKAELTIRGVLQGLGLTEDQNDFAAFLAIGNNLKMVKAKGERGGKVYKTANNAGNLEKSFTNFETQNAKLFNVNAAININAAGWKAIQHFPAKADAVVGIQEKTSEEP